MTWKPTLFSELAEFRNGLNFVKNDNGRTIKIVGVSDFKDYIELESLDTLEQITIKGSLKSEDLLQDDDLLFVRSNGNKKLIGRCMIIKIGNQEISYSGFTIRARLKSKEVLPRFLVQLFRSAYIKDQIQTVGGGTNISNLSQSILGDLKIPLPPLLEQCRIAEVLGVWDESIDLLEKLIGKTRSRKQGLMQQLLTGKKRFKEFEGSEWKKVSIGEIAFVDKRSLNNSTPKNYTFFYISLSDLDNGHISNNLEQLCFEKAPSRARRLVSNNDILLATVRPNLKSFAIVKTDADKYVVSTGFAVITVKKDYCADYLYQYIFSNHIEKQIEALVTGSNYPAINSTEIKNLSVYCPSLPEQEKIAAVLSAADEEISTLEKQLAAYKQQKLGLMQQLLTGKIRVGMI